MYVARSLLTMHTSRSIRSATITFRAISGCVLVALAAMPAHARAQLPFDTADVDLVPPCVRRGDDVFCWGEGAGGLALAPVPELRGARGLVSAGRGVCGLRGGEVVCSTSRWSVRRATVLGHDGDVGCSAVGARELACREGLRIRVPGRVASVLWRDVGCGPVYSPRAFTLLANGRVVVDGCSMAPWTEIRDVVQIEGSHSRFCTRDRRGAIECFDLRAGARLEPDVLGAMGRRTGYVDLAVSYDTVCALDGAGTVSCARTAGDSIGRVETLAPTGVRDIAFHGGVLCVLDGSGVQCDGLGGSWLQHPIRVLGLPPVRRAAAHALGPGRYLGCAIDREDALWCWGERDPERVREQVVAVGLATQVLATIDREGTLRADGWARSHASLAAFWPGSARDVVLRARSVGNATRICGASGDEVRCADVVEGPGARIQALTLVADPSDADREYTQRRNSDFEVDAEGTWWHRMPASWGTPPVRLQDDIVWWDTAPTSSEALGVDRAGRLWVSAPSLTNGIAGPTGRPGAWVRLALRP
jgi:hypothetical protein